MSARRGIRVLVAEDDYLVSEMIKALLEKTGYTVAGEAVNGLEAVEMTQSLRPDVVLMDIRMPDMDGIEATRLIQERCPTPVVVLTAYEAPELVEQASEAGVGAYLVKPANGRSIERSVTIAMARFEDAMELRRLNDDLQARNEELNAFVQTVAHDLQNPLAVIIGHAEVLAKHRTAMSAEELQTGLRAIERIGRKMSRTTNQRLLLAGAGQMEVEMKPLDMAEIVKEAEERLADRIDEYEAEIIAPDTWPAAVGHGPWVEEVWVQYLSNAIKHGGRPPRVALGARAESDGTVSFWVRDNGPGVTPEDQARLFKPFTRLGEPRAKGHGLGLSIVRRIVERLRGEVGVESEVGEGSTFTFTLPGQRKKSS